MLKKILLGTALSVFAVQAMAATVSYEVAGEVENSRGIIREQVFFGIEFDLETIPFQLPNSEITVSGEFFEANSLSVSQNGSTTVFDTGFADTLPAIFPWISSLRAGFISFEGEVTLELDATGTVTDFRGSADDENVFLTFSSSGCNETDFNSGTPSGVDVFFTCTSAPFVRQTGAAVTTTTAVPVPLPSLMLGAGLLGFLGLRRKKSGIA